MRSHAREISSWQSSRRSSSCTGASCERRSALINSLLESQRLQTVLVGVEARYPRREAGNVLKQSVYFTLSPPVASLIGGNEEGLLELRKFTDRHPIDTHTPHCARPANRRKTAPPAASHSEKPTRGSLVKRVRAAGGCSGVS